MMLHQYSALKSLGTIGGLVGEKPVTFPTTCPNFFYQFHCILVDLFTEGMSIRMSQ